MCGPVETEQEEVQFISFVLIKHAKVVFFNTWERLSSAQGKNTIQNKLQEENGLAAPSPTFFAN